MKKTQSNRWVFALLCTLLIAALAVSITGCGEDPQTPAVTNTAPAQTVGTGKTAFTFTVTDPDGKTTAFTVNTDAETVGQALLDVGLIAGEDGAYGLYVKTVNGLTLDYDKDGKYWAFYENDVYAAASVEKTAVTPGATYGFKAE